MKMFVVRPHPNPLLQGEGITHSRFGYSTDHLTNPAAQHSRGLQTIHPLLGGEGRGEVVRFFIPHQKCSAQRNENVFLLVLTLTFSSEERE